MPDDRTDLYDVLGLNPGATQREISHAYRAMLRRHHPDTRRCNTDAGGSLAASDAGSNTASDRVLQQVLAAYAVLRDPDRRADYDRRRSRLRPGPAPREQRPTRPEQPPIQAGPVRWHPSGSAR